MSNIKKDGTAATAAEESAGRRQVLHQMGRFAAVTAPSVVLLLAAGLKPTSAQTRVSNPNPGPPISSRQFKNLGSAVDPRHALAIAAAGVQVGNAIDGIGLCLAAVQGLVQRIHDLEAQLAIN